VDCPHCGKETFLYASPQAKPAPKPAAPATPPPQKPTAPVRSKIPGVVCIVAGVFVVCALCLASFLIGKSSQKQSDQSSGAKPKNDLLQLFTGTQGKKPAAKKVTFPPPPTSGIELSYKLFHSFPERVENRTVWMDGKFGELNDYFKGDFPGGQVGFSTYDKSGELFSDCCADRQKFADFLLNLKYNTSIRIIGRVQAVYDGNNSYPLTFRVESIQVIE
jgi:hypothetical protein